MFYWELEEPIGETVDRRKLKKVCKNYNLISKVIKTEKDEAVIYESVTTMYVVIGGSSGDGAEWKDNFTAYPLIDGVHNGIFNSSVDILNKVTKYIDSTHKPLVWVGYSRGGGLAQECCRRTRGKAVVFGSMRPFSRRKTKKLSFECHQVRGKRDIVTRVPWAWLPPLWATYKTSETVFPAVRGFDHKKYREMIELM